MASSWMDEILAVVAARLHPRATVTSVAAAPLRAGTSAEEVVEVTLELATAGRRRRVPLVLKRLAGAARRESSVYRALARDGGVERFGPRLVALEAHASAEVLVLERVAPSARWPWRDVRAAAAVLERAAALHALDVRCALAWDVDAELERSAHETARALEDARRAGTVTGAGPGARALARLVPDAVRIRRAVVHGGPFPPTLIHGDLHPGNVMLARRGGAAVPVMLDWGRARLGSPLEDVASWVQSLGCWEPEARRRHDALVGSYLRARAPGTGLTRDVRDGLWLAGAVNALSGALRFQLDAAQGGRPTRARAGALRAARDWLRIIRRADAVWAAPRRRLARRAGARARRTPAPCGARAPTPAS